MTRGRCDDALETIMTKGDHNTTPNTRAAICACVQLFCYRLEIFFTVYYSRSEAGDTNGCLLLLLLL